MDSLVSSKRWALLAVFLTSMALKYLACSQLFASKMRKLITFYVSSLSIKLDQNQAAGSTVVGGRDSKSQRQADYMHKVYIRKNTKT